VNQHSTAGSPALRTDLPASSSRGDLEMRALSRADRIAPAVFILPAVLIVLAMSIFPLIISLYLSLTRFELAPGGFTFHFIGTLNYDKLLFGSQQFQFLGVLNPISPIGWIAVAIVAGGSVWMVIRAERRRATRAGGLGTAIIGLGLTSVTMMFASSLSGKSELGSLSVTLIYVFVGIAVQYLFGLGLALLCAQKLAGRRFFRVVFFLPMMITPVGIAYTFRMLTDTSIGPFAPIFDWFGLRDWAWAATAGGARMAVMIGDAWQWIPFNFIILLAAIEAQPRDQLEAAMVDGANRWQMFRYITIPTILPVSITLVLIRVIEAFKIVDLPNVLTNGGPGIATESLSLHSFIAWRTLDIGGSAAVAYLLLIVVTFVCVSFVSMTRGAQEAG